jgi:HTH-type transcriptional repressor of NAD biosynthesis genes
VPYRTIETLTEEGHSWILLNGDHHRRMQTVIEITDLILLRRSGFTSPPWATRTVLWPSTTPRS